MSFYKYRSVKDDDYTKNMVLRNEIFLASPESFNDPFDINPVISLKSEKKNQLKKFNALLKKYATGLNRSSRRKFSRDKVKEHLNTISISSTEEKMQESLKSSLHKDLGIFCLSKEVDSILMWSHYAESHKGICLEYDEEYFLDLGIEKVNYFDKRQSSNEYHDSSISSVDKIFLSKYSGWSYEKEWRLIAENFKSRTSIIKKDTLKSIYIGSLASKELIKEVISWNNLRGNDLNIFIMKTDKKKYSLYAEKLM